VIVAELMRYAAGILLIAGGIFSALAALGLLRFPDLYTRFHAASLGGALGLGLVFIAIALTSFDLAVAVRALLGLLFLLLTAPVAAHLLARAARQSGVEPTANTNTSEMRKDG
jgi:multicomponent Na+:H+ antiporter subunit G